MAHACTAQERWHTGKTSVAEQTHFAAIRKRANNIGAGHYPIARHSTTDTAVAHKRVCHAAVAHEPVVDDDGVRMHWMMIRAG